MIPYLIIRATFVKGDPYIRDMKNTASVSFYFNMPLKRFNRVSQRSCW